MYRFLLLPLPILSLVPAWAYACEFGELRCNGNVVQSCEEVDDQGVWMNAQDCGVLGEECTEIGGTAVCEPPACEPLALEFEDAREGTAHAPGSRFFSGGFVHGVEAFEESTGYVHTSGQIRFSSLGYANGTGKQLDAGTAVLELGVPKIESLSLEYAETGYEAFISIDGDSRHASLVQDLDGEILGGMMVIVSPWSSDSGLLTLERLTSSADEVLLGGHEFFMDSAQICAIVPELTCPLGQTRCTGDVVERCGHDVGPTATESGWLAEDCGATGGRCFEAADGARCIELLGTSPGTYFADPENYIFVKANLKWQFHPAPYDRSSDDVKTPWSEWSDIPGVIPNKPDLLAAIDDAVAWLEDPNRASDFHAEPAVGGRRKTRKSGPTVEGQSRSSGFSGGFLRRRERVVFSASRRR